MHFIITDPWMAKPRAFHLSGLQLSGLAAAAALMLIVMSIAAYHLVFVHGARQGWPVITPIVNLIASRERMGQERYLKENLEVMAKKMGDMQARLVQLDALGERVAALAGLSAAEVKPKPGAGGPLVLPENLSIDYLNVALEGMDAEVTQRNDLLVHAESRLFTDRMRKYMLPTAQPVPGVDSGSGFGWRVDPVTGQRALHTGLDFSADVGTPILAAAGGVVVTQEYHVAYGNMIEIDHGNELITRYAHASQVSAKMGEIVKRGQQIATVGSTGRSTGPHLHFEVWLDGVAQDPQHFLRAPSEDRMVAAKKLASGPKPAVPAR